MKIKLLIIHLLLLIFTVFAEEPPISNRGWHWEEGEFLNGELFYDVSESYREQEGWAYIEGHGKIHYWLYDTYIYHSGHGSAISDIYVPRWLESMGYVIDFDHICHVSPNTALATSVKALMKQRNCDVSVALIGADTSKPYVVINSYDMNGQYYWTDVIPLIK